jgi:hypothetical protein
MNPSRRLRDRRAADVLCRFADDPDVGEAAAVAVQSIEARAIAYQDRVDLALPGDVSKFRLAKKGRDDLMHGSITDPDDLPLGEVADLVRKYLDLALIRLLG